MYGDTIYNITNLDVHCIDINTLKLNTVINFDVYIVIGNKYYMAIQNGDILTQNIYESLLLLGKLFITLNSQIFYIDYVFKLLNSVNAEKKEANMIYHSASHIMFGLFEDNSATHFYERTKILLHVIIDFIINNQQAFKNITEIGSFDDYTHIHSLDVALYTVCFSKYLGFNLNDIYKIGKASLMHDIGKSMISEAIVNKNGKLTEDEFEIMKMHPVYSYEIVRSHKTEDSDILAGIRHHHEKVGGDGYPDGLFANKIHLFAKIIAITDIFSALTRRRPYKKAYIIKDAMALMQHSMSHDLDKRLLSEFFQFVSDIYQVRLTQ